MLNFYKRFVCGVYAIQSSMHHDIPMFMTFAGVIFLNLLVLMGVDSLVFILFNIARPLGNKLNMGLVLTLMGVVNYIFVFKEEQFMKYYARRIPVPVTWLIIVLVFLFGMILTTVAGPGNIPH